MFMEANSKIYCILEHFCLYQIEDRQSLKKAKSIYLSQDDVDVYVYVEEYQNFQTLEARIVELNQIWRQRYPEKEKYWTQEEKEAYYQDSIVYDRVRDIYLAVLLYNRWGDHMVVGVSDSGWTIPGSSRYTIEYKNNQIKLGKYDITKEKQFLFYLPEYTEFSSSDFISKETACSLLKEWLDTGEYTQYFFNESDELMTRKYTYNPN
jgi:hypothetical protein